LIVCPVTLAARAEARNTAMAAGDFTGGGRNDLVVVNRGSDSFSVLSNDGQGGFANPQLSLTTSASDGTATNTQAGPVVAGHFHGPGKPTDLALLLKDRGEVWIYTGNGNGTFRHTFSIAAGSQPTGLNVVLNPQTGFDDLLVGDPFGDVLHLQGKGDGTFQIAGRRTTLAVQQLSNGHTDVLVANQESDRITIQTPKPGSSQLTPIVTLANGSHSTLAPGAVQWAKLDKNSPYDDAVVVASGGNEVLVYRGTGFDAKGNPTFAAPVSYPVGTNPVSVTIQDLNGDGIADLIVTNQGSNDVSLMFGSWDGSGHWVGTPGERLKSGSGPIAAQAVFPADGGLPELVIINGQSGTLAVLPGVGQGFFNDQNPQIVNLPGNPVLTQGPTFFGSTGSGIVVTATGQLIGFNLNNLSSSGAILFTPPPGEGVAAAQALADGHVVAVLSSGTVVDLEPTKDGLLTVDSTFAPLAGIPSEPSALAVLQEESGIQVLVTGAGNDQVFAFGIVEPLGSPVLPEASSGPLVEVTPLAGEPLTVVVTLTAGTGPAGGVTVQAAPLIPPGNEVAAEVVDESAAELLFPGLSALGVVPPAWVPALLTRLPGSAPAEDVAGEAIVEVVPKAGVAAEPPRPGGNILDLEQQLRELDLYQPTPSPDRPGPSSRRPGEQRGLELIARTPAVDAMMPLADLAVASEEGESSRWMAGLGEVVEAMAADLKAGSTPAEVSDAVLVQTPLAWGEERWRLLGLAGLALWPWLGCGSQPAGETEAEAERPRRQPANGRAGVGTARES
jgi:hypothetical protein